MNISHLYHVMNALALPATIFGNIRHANWRGAAQQSGAVGVAAEALQAAVGTNTEPFFVPLDSGWQINDIEALLLRHGIKLWGVAYWNNELYFRVKSRQGHWAQYVLLRAGVPLLHGWLDGSRAIPGYNQQAQARSGGGDHLIDSLLDLAGSLFGH